MKMRSTHVVVKHFESFHNAAMDTKIVFEIGSKDGIDYEVLISDSGEIVSIEEED